ncbi:uncharacterized protein LOC107367742 [Tetranychus urticae]|nr:uncharacterized protein LOC107367742 [Tetranychus urticae]
MASSSGNCVNFSTIPLQNSIEHKDQIEALECLEKLLDKLDETQIVNEVLPVLGEIRPTDPAVVMPIARMYMRLLTDKKFGIEENILATKIMPAMLPVVVNPNLAIDEFNFLSDLLQKMLNQITKSQRDKILPENLASQLSPSTEKVPIEINFNQPTNPLYPQRPPTLKIESRRQSGDEVSVSDPSSPENSNLLGLPGSNLKTRRHSDNAINIPRIEIALSSPTVDNRSMSRVNSTSNLTNRRHSSINPTEISNLNQRRHSSINLQDLQQFHRRRHSAINPHDIKRVANKISRAADDMLCSAVDSLESKTSQLKIDFNPVPMISPTKGRRSSVAALFGSTPSPSLFGHSPNKTSNKLLTKVGLKKAKTPTKSEKLLNSLGTGMQHFLGK